MRLPRTRSCGYLRCDTNSWRIQGFPIRPVRLLFGRLGRGPLYAHHHADDGAHVERKNSALNVQQHKSAAFLSMGFWTAGTCDRSRTRTAGYRRETGGEREKSSVFPLRLGGMKQPPFFIKSFFWLLFQFGNLSPPGSLS